LKSHTSIHGALSDDWLARQCCSRVPAAAPAHADDGGRDNVTSLDKWEKQEPADRLVRHLQPETVLELGYHPAAHTRVPGKILVPEPEAHSRGTDRPAKPYLVKHNATLPEGTYPELVCTLTTSSPVARLSLPDDGW
jgi:hypothetical protein